MVNAAKNFLIKLRNLQQMHLKLVQKDQFKKHRKQLVISLIIRVLKELLKFEKKSQQNNSEAVRNEHNKEIPKERHISPEERQKNNDDLRLV